MQIQKEKLQKAYDEGSKEIKNMLLTLCPELETKYFDLSKLVADGDGLFIFTNNSSLEAGFDNYMFMSIRAGCEYENKAFYLNNKYNWELTRDSSNILCLIPTKKS